MKAALVFLIASLAASPAHAGVFDNCRDPKTIKLEIQELNGFLAQEGTASTVYDLKMEIQTRSADNLSMCWVGFVTSDGYLRQGVLGWHYDLNGQVIITYQDITPGG